MTYKGCLHASGGRVMISANSNEHCEMWAVDFRPKQPLRDYFTPDVEMAHIVPSSFQLTTRTLCIEN
jgi:hypothetical protein